MKMFLMCLSMLMLVLAAIALPRTEASDAAARDASKNDRRDDAGVILLAQVRPEKNSSRASDPAKPKAADDKRTAKKSSNAKSKRVTPITAEIEAEVGKFVGEHHRELLDVLKHLKDNLPKEYERAVRDLNRNRMRLQQLEGRDRYAVELQIWKAQSRARLLGARVQMDDDDGLRDTLRDTLAEIYDLRASLVQRDRERTVERLKKLDEQLKSLRKDRDENLEKQLAALTKNTPNRTKPVKTNARNVKPAPSKRTPIEKNKTTVKKSSTKPID